jgi:hypothetical protein
VGDGDNAGLGTGALALVCQLEECPDLVDGEAERPSPADEGQPLEVLGPVEPIAARAPQREGQEADPLVVADRLDVAPVRFERVPMATRAGAVSMSASPQGWKNPLESVVTTDFILAPQIRRSRREGLVPGR